MSGNGHQEIAADKNLYRIGEVSRLTDTKPFVLRYWETEFPMLQPVKSPKGHRLYRREDVDTVLQDQAAALRRRVYHRRRATSPARTSAKGRRNWRPGPAEPQARSRASDGSSRSNISRKVLLDLRDSLRAFLTLLEAE